MPSARLAVAATLAALAVVASSVAAPRTPKLGFSVFVHTSQNMDSIVWTGQEFLYVQNTENTVFSGPPTGLPIHVFATMPKLVEETRCILSPGTHGWPSGSIFCHSPDDKIYELPAAGSVAKTFDEPPAAGNS